MFVGHYAAALAAKAWEPKAPLWTLAGACQLMDIAWSGLIMAGVEHMRPDPAAPGGMDLYFMPYTHSLPASLLWSLAAGLVARWGLRLGARAGWAIGLVVFSHWVLDLLVHGPDLLLWPGGPKVGFGFWSLPTAEMALEMGLVAIAATAWMGVRRDLGGKIWSAAAFVTLLTAIQVLSSLMPASGDTITEGIIALTVYLGLTLAAWAVDRTPKTSPA
jgi:hypothetical protein